MVELASGVAGLAFGDVAGHRDRRSPQLACQAVTLFGGERLRRAIDCPLRGSFPSARQRDHDTIRPCLPPPKISSHCIMLLGLRGSKLKTRESQMGKEAPRSRIEEVLNEGGARRVQADHEDDRGVYGCVFVFVAAGGGSRRAAGVSGFTAEARRTTGSSGLWWHQSHSVCSLGNSFAHPSWHRRSSLVLPSAETHTRSS